MCVLIFMLLTTFQKTEGLGTRTKKYWDINNPEKLKNILHIGVQKLNHLVKHSSNILLYQGPSHWESAALNTGC